MIVLLISATASLFSGCIASKKFVRTEVKTSSDALSTRIEANETDIKEAHDGISRVDARVTGVDTRVTGVDDRLTKVSTEQTQRMDGLKGDVQTVDKKAVDARTAADRVGTEVNALDQRFENRNNFSVANQYAITFRFDSDKLDPKQQPTLDQIAGTLKENPDAVLVMEGRTDSTGDSEYNVKLGERRIESVRRYLVVEKGVPIYKIHEISFGAAQPIAENKTREGREKNRAVALMILLPREQTAANTREQ
jgi:outer membrane protein OmpA-like peptidoglycan-associated protein